MTRQSHRRQQEPSSPRSSQSNRPAARAAGPRSRSKPGSSQASKKRPPLHRPAVAQSRKSPWKIELNNQQAILAINARLVRRTVDAVLRHERVKSAEISVAVVDDAAIHSINRDFLQHDFPTDVISFLLEEPEVPPISRRGTNGTRPAAVRPRGQGKMLSGEVIVSAEMAQRRAADFGWNGLDELMLYLVHGVLHLCGYDDLTRNEQSLMRQREKEVLATLGLVPGYDDEA